MRIALVFAVCVMAACGDPTSPVRVHTFELIALLSPYLPSDVVMLDSCTGQANSTIESGTMVLREDGTLTLSIEAWEDAGGCYSLMTSLPIERTGTWAILPHGSMNFRFDDNSYFGDSPVGAVDVANIDRFPLHLPSPTLFGPEKVWELLNLSTWERR